MDKWLSRTEIISIASEFLSQEYSDRIQERTFYIHNHYSDKIVSNDLLDKVIEIVKHYRDYFDERILNYVEPVKFENIAEEIENYRKSVRAKPVTNYVPPIKTDEQITQLRESYKIPRLILIGKYVTGLRGEINRNEVERILENIIVAKNKIATNKTLTHEQQAQKKDEGVEIKSLQELLENNLDECVQILKDVMADENRYPLDANGRWTRKKDDLSILVAWMEAIRQAGKFKISAIDDRKKSELLNSYFPGIDFNTNDTSMWRKATEKYSQYKQLFDKRLK